MQGGTEFLTSSSDNSTNPHTTITRTYTAEKQLNIETMHGGNVRVGDECTINQDSNNAIIVNKSYLNQIPKEYADRLITIR